MSLTEFPPVSALENTLTPPIFAKVPNPLPPFSPGVATHFEENGPQFSAAVKKTENELLPTIGCLLLFLLLLFGLLLQRSATPGVRDSTRLRCAMDHTHTCWREGSVGLLLLLFFVLLLLLFLFLLLFLVNCPPPHGQQERKTNLQPAPLSVTLRFGTSIAYVASLQ